MSLRKSSNNRKGSKSVRLPKPNARRRWTPAPSRVGLDLMNLWTGRMDMSAPFVRWFAGREGNVAEENQRSMPDALNAGVHHEVTKSTKEPYGAPGLILNSRVEGKLVSVTPVLWSQTLSDGSAGFGPEAAPQKLNRASRSNGVLLTSPQLGEPAGT